MLSLLVREKYANRLECGKREMEDCKIYMHQYIMKCHSRRKVMNRSEKQRVPFYGDGTMLKREMRIIPKHGGKYKSGNTSWNIAFISSLRFCLSRTDQKE